MMNIASRTPDGQPIRCPVCGGQVCIKPSLALGNASCADVPCAKCGTLLWFVCADGESRIYPTSTIQSLASRVKAALGKLIGVTAEDVASETSFLEDLSADSLDTVELIMELEEERHRHSKRSGRANENRSRCHRVHSITEVARGVALLPACTSTAYFNSVCERRFC